MTEREEPVEPPAGRPRGMAGSLAPEVSVALAAVSRVARALAGTGGLAELAEHALAEMRRALSLDTAVLYLPDEARPVLRRHVESPAVGERAARADLTLDDEAWHLAVASGHPLVFGERGSWLLDNPFDPPAEHWLVLPLVAEGDLVGVAMAARSAPLELDPTTAIVLSLLSDQLGAGIATARLRRELERVAMERERLRLAAQLHDGLAQDLALAVRELSLLESRPDPEIARASHARLKAALDEAHQIVRARLSDLTASPPLDGVGPAVFDICRRFARLGLPVYVDAPGRPLQTPPATTAVVDRVLTEALANAHRHAAADRVDVRLTADPGRGLELVVQDDGRGFDAATVAGRDTGHLGLSLMRERAREAGGDVRIDSRPLAGTRVALTLPLAAPAAPRRGDA